MTDFALLLTSTTVVVLAGFLLTVIMRPTSTGEVVVGTGALSIALIEVDSLLVGGLLEAYRPGPLLFGAFCLLLITAAPLIGQRGRQAAIDTAQLMWVGLRDGVRLAPRHPVVVVLAVAVTAVYGVRAYLSVRLPNVDWDGLYYHLVGIDEWVTSGRITHSTLVLWADVYPQSVELFVGWTCVHLHNTVYAGLAQLPIFFIGGAAVAGLARRVGARRSHAALAGLLYLATPLVMAQFGTNYVDASAASFGLAALYLVTGLPRAVDLNPGVGTIWVGRLATAGMVVGLASGAKSTNLVLAPILVIYILAVLWKGAGGAPASATARRQLLRSGPTSLIGILLFGIAALAVGGYWYIRTWAKFGNPVYPFAVAGFPGPVPLDHIITPHIPERMSGHNVVVQIAMSWAGDFHPFHTVDYSQRVGGMGMQWVLVLLPLSIVAVALWWREGRRGPAGLLMLILVCVVVTSPAPWWARYQLLNAGLAAALSGYAITWLAQKIRSPAAVRTVASLTLLGVVGTSMWWSTRTVPYAIEGKADYLSLGATLDLAAQDDRANLVFPWFLFKPLAKVPHGSSIAVLGDGSRLFTHPLFGNRYEHDVVAVGAVSDADELSAKLDKRHVQFVVLDDDAPVLHEVLDDVSRFRPLSSEGQMGNARLFQYGEFSGLPQGQEKGP